MISNWLINWLHSCFDSEVFGVCYIRTFWMLYLPFLAEHLILKSRQFHNQVQLSASCVSKCVTERRKQRKAELTGKVWSSRPLVWGRRRLGGAHPEGQTPCGPVVLVRPHHHQMVPATLNWWASQEEALFSLCGGLTLWDLAFLSLNRSCVL